MRDRRGMVLIIVVVVVAMISLAGLSFVATMSTESKAVRVQGKQLQLEHVVGSGAELLKAFCEQSQEKQQEAGGSWDNSDLFRGVLVLEDEENGRYGYFSVVSPQIEEGDSAGIRFGVEDESARLNLGVLPDWEARQPGSARQALMSLPSMTENIADAILDWIDSDSDQREFGAEAEYYQGLGVPYSPRNGVPQCLEELLLVRGVTRELLFGADANFNHQIEPGERSAVSRPSEGTAAARGLPWASLLTVSSAERNRTQAGKPRIHLNQGDLKALHKELEAALGRTWADFIVLYRQYGPYEGSRSPTASAKLSVDWSAKAQWEIESILDLVDAKVEVTSSNEETSTIVASPLTSEPTSLRQHLAKLWDRTSTVADPVLFGRVNVNLAPREVLRAVPGMESTVVEQILAARGSPGTREGTARRDPTWLLSEGIVDLQRMKPLLPYLTGGGDVVRAQIVGFFEEPGPSVRVETVLDATASPPRQVYWKDLRLLGRGYPLESLGTDFSDLLGY